MTSSRYIYAIVTILLLITPAFAHEDNREETQVIKMVPSGFEPSEIVIKQGTTLIFENIDTGPRWPASNIHPTHGLYPKSGIEKCGTDEEPYIFDACREIQPSEIYKFTFNHTGKWRMHDHILPELTGTIVVIKEEGFKIPDINTQKNSVFEKLRNFLKIAYTKAQFALFPDKLEKALGEKTYFQIAGEPDQLAYWLKILGPEKMMEGVLKESGGGSEIDCHAQAHQIGRMAYQLFGADVFAKGDASCHSGYYHGAMEFFISEKGTEDLSYDITELCSMFDTTFGTFECLHGVGHGVMAFEAYDLPKALEDCRLLRDEFSKTSCYGGVFMENIVAGQGGGAIQGHETQWVSNDPHFPCNAIGDDYSTRFQCYQMQTSWMLTLAEYDFNKIIDWCMDATPEMTHVCFKSFGRDAAGHTLRDPDKIIEYCNKVPVTDGYRSQCHTGAVNVIIDFWGPKLSDQAHEFCNKLDLQESVACESVINSRTGEFLQHKTQ